MASPAGRRCSRAELAPVSRDLNNRPPTDGALKGGPESRIVDASMATTEGVRELALSLPRTHEALVGDPVKFRVGRIVYLALSRDETLMGFAFPKEEREALVASEPDKFMMPGLSDLRYNWAIVRLAAIDDVEMREIVLDAWRMVVPVRVAAAHLGD